MLANSQRFVDLEVVPSAPPHVTMTVGEFCRILRDADDSDRTWLQDFADDEIHVPTDLFVVMQAYWSMKSAA